MGNCGVGFAPAAPDRHDWLIGLMEGVEGIPGASLREAIRWDWQSVPEYMDALDRIPRALDVAVQVPHGAVRAYVMGERGAANEPATDDDIARMAELVAEGVAAGAVGVSANRLELHKSVDGREVPGHVRHRRRARRPRPRRGQGVGRRRLQHDHARRRRQRPRRVGPRDRHARRRVTRDRHRDHVRVRRRLGAPTGATASRAWSARTPTARASSRR